MADPKEQVNEFAAESEAAGQQQSDEQAVAETFGGVDGQDAFGITTKAPEKATQDKPVEEKPEGKTEGKAEETKTEETKPEVKETSKQAEIKDELIEKLKLASPEFKELSESKKFKNIGEVVKAYHELEKLHGNKANQLSTYRKGLEQYCTFDESGNINGYTEIGKQALALLDKKDVVPGTASQEAAKAGFVGLSPAQEAELEKARDQFFDMLEKNPVAAIAKIVLGVTQHSLKGHKDEFSKSLSEIQDKLKPILEEREERKMLSLIDDVAKEQVANGDDKANEFIDEYAPEIEAELKKIDIALRKSNPKLAIQQAYLIVKDKKVQEWKNQMKEKQDAEQKKAQAGASTGASSGGGAEPENPEEIEGMLNAAKAKSDGSVFFGL